MHSKYTLIPVSEVVVPKDRYYCLLDRWWVVVEKDGEECVLCYGKKYYNPQCHKDKDALAYWWKYYEHELNITCWEFKHIPIVYWRG
jgi:hypothetical protein